MQSGLTVDEKTYLLRLAREAIRAAVEQKPPPRLDASQLTAALTAPGASFVTLTKQGYLRGCIGALAANQPLAEDIREHAAAAALEDPRFPPVRPAEVPDLHIEISRLTEPQPLNYQSPEDLLSLIRPMVDGVILRDGFRRATFLPQVWKQIPKPADFLGQLCRKMGASPDLWRQKVLEVAVYQVEEFEELK